MSIVWLAYSAGFVLVVLSIREAGMRLVECFRNRRARSSKPVVLDLTAYKQRKRRRVS